PVSVEAVTEGYGSQNDSSLQSWSHRHGAGGDLLACVLCLAFNRAPTDTGSAESSRTTPINGYTRSRERTFVIRHSSFGLCHSSFRPDQSQNFADDHRFFVGADHADGCAAVGRRDHRGILIVAIGSDSDAQEIEPRADPFANDGRIFADAAGKNERV